MKFVNLETFRSMPAGTLFNKYEPCFFEPLSVKGDTWYGDFLYMDLSDPVDMDDRKQLPGHIGNLPSNVKLDFDCYGRDGFFDNDQIFAVWEPHEVKSLIAFLEQSLKSTAEAHQPS